jgi:hypothetical protein
MTVFTDGTGVTPGTENCKCRKDCEFPCWQRLGWAPPCPTCTPGGCNVDTGYVDTQEA